MSLSSKNGIKMKKTFYDEKSEKLTEQNSKVSSWFEKGVRTLTKPTQLNQTGLFCFARCVYFWKNL